MIPAIAAQGTTIVAVQTASLVKSIRPLGNASES